MQRIVTATVTSIKSPTLVEVKTEEGKTLLIKTSGVATSVTPREYKYRYSPKIGDTVAIEYKASGMVDSVYHGDTIDVAKRRLAQYLWDNGGREVAEREAQQKKEESVSLLREFIKKHLKVFAEPKANNDAELALWKANQAQVLPLKQASLERQWAELNAVPKVITVNQGSYNTANEDRPEDYEIVEYLGETYTYFKKLLGWAQSDSEVLSSDEMGYRYASPTPITEFIPVAGTTKEYKELRTHYGTICRDIERRGNAEREEIEKLQISSPRYWGNLFIELAESPPVCWKENELSKIFTLGEFKSELESILTQD